ncbi:hypothetical protein GJ496_009483 [Pomphorhynchus laevis]|nr:hypothetical protein GJ496_009483 [Pomphorhynchus laevis]
MWITIYRPVESMSIARKVIDNFLASNDEALANELIKWIELKISTLNLASNQYTNDDHNGHKQDNNYTLRRIFPTQNFDSEQANREIRRVIEANSLQRDCGNPSEPVDSVQLLNCTCGNSFLLRLSISQCLPGIMNHSTSDDHSDINDTNYQGEDAAEDNNNNGYDSVSDEFQSVDDSRQSRKSNRSAHDERHTTDETADNEYANNLYVNEVNNDRSRSETNSTNDVVQTRFNKRKAIHPVKIDNALSNKMDKESCFARKIVSATELPETCNPDIYAFKLDEPGSMTVQPIEMDTCKKPLTNQQSSPTDHTSSTQIDRSSTNRSPLYFNRCIHQSGVHDSNIMVTPCNKALLNSYNNENYTCLNSEDEKQHLLKSNAYMLLKSKLIANGMNSIHNNRCITSQHSNSHSSTNGHNQKQQRYSPSSSNGGGSKTNVNDSNQETTLEYITPEGKRQFRCPVCLNNYANRSGLNRHYITHSPDDLWKAECHICGKKYSRKDSLKHHIKTQHNTMNATDSQRMHSSYRGHSEGSCLAHCNSRPTKVPKLEPTDNIKENSLIKEEPCITNGNSHPTVLSNTSVERHLLEQSIEEDQRHSKPVTPPTYSSPMMITHSNSGCIPSSNNYGNAFSSQLCRYQTTSPKNGFHVE